MILEGSLYRQFATWMRERGSKKKSAFVDESSGRGKGVELSGDLRLGAANGTDSCGRLGETGCWLQFWCQSHSRLGWEPPLR